MVYLIEGPDGAGKTIFASQLLNQLGTAKYIHRTNKTDYMSNSELVKDYAELLRSSTKDLVVDRCWVSAYVYGAVLGNRNELFSLESIYFLEEICCKRGAMYIFATAPTQTLIKRCMTRGNNLFEDAATFGTVASMYNTFFNEIPHHIPVLRWAV